MTWYEKARSFTFPKTGPATDSSLESQNPNQTGLPHGEPPLQKSPSQYILRSATAPTGQATLVPETVSSYNLDWIELLPFLRKKYPNVKFVKDQFGTEDHFIFSVPKNKPLTDEDRKKIDQIRAEHRARENPALRKPRQERSPEPPPRRSEDDETDEDECQ